MPDKYNRLRNADFTAGVRKPTAWTWSADSDAVRWRFHEAETVRRVVLTSAAAGAGGCWSQRVRCRAEHRYRIEAVVTAECDGGSDRGGATLSVVAWTSAGRQAERVRIASVVRTAGPTTLRGYYRTPAAVTSLDVCAGLSGAIGTVTIHSVLVIPNEEPDAQSNPLALPPPPYAYPPPRKVRRVCVCDDGDVPRPLVALLSERFGRGAVEHRRTREVPLGALKSDALLVPASRVPPQIHSVGALERLASRQLVIVSLDAFARLAGCGASLRTVVQPDDPIGAKIIWANFITRGFALHDVAPWPGTTADGRVFRQRHLRRTSAFHTWCKERGYEVILTSDTDADGTSNQPICLYKEIAGGGVIVFDADVVEAAPSTRDEPNLWAFVLLNMLGADQVSCGQFTVPASSEKEWHQTLDELTQRFPAIRRISRPGRSWVLEIGGDESRHGLPAPLRPVILIRTGLRGDDHAGMYGCMQLFKQLVRPAPYDNPYIRNLLTRFRLVWLPLCAPFQAHGCDASRPEPRQERHAFLSRKGDVDGAFHPDAIAAIIDVTTHPTQQVRITYADGKRHFDRRAALIAQLATAFVQGRYCYRAVGEGEPMGWRHRSTWQAERWLPTVRVDPGAFSDEFDASAAAACLVRIELPGTDGDFVSNSIRRTDLAATLLEHVIGVHYGVLAVNRGATRVAFGDHPPLAAGEAIDIPVDRKGALRDKRVG